MGKWTVHKEDDTYDIDKWLGEADEDYCYTCQDWVETKPDEVDVCNVCNNHIDAVNDDIRATRKIINNSTAPFKKSAMEALDLIDNHMTSTLVDFNKQIKFIKLNKETDKLMEQNFNDVFVKYQIVKVPGQRTKELIRV